MAEAVFDSEVQAVKPPPKRRRILDPSAIVPVPVYSNKVSSSLQLKPMAATFTEKKSSDDSADESLWSQPSQRPSSSLVILSDSEEDEPEHTKKKTAVEDIRSPSPPPPDSLVQKQSKQVRRKISEIDRKLRAVNSLLTPEPQNRRTRRRQNLPSADEEDVVELNSDDLSYSSLIREIPLKIRCRTDVHKIPVLSSTPFGDVVTRLSDILHVPPSRLLLLREEMELPTDSTVSELGLGIADIIECVVMAAEDESEVGGGGGGGSSGGGGGGSTVGGSITVRLQSKDRDSSQEFSLHRDAPLGSIFSQYLSKMSSSARRTVRFHFDGSKVTHSQTPAQLDMEDGDIIEVWI